MAPRIQPVEEPNSEQRELLAKTLTGSNGQPLNIFATLAHHPRLMSRVNALGGYFMVYGTITARERELVILRTAALARSQYEMAQHRRIGADEGLATEEIEAALNPDSPHAWSAHDRALLRFTDDLFRTDTVSDDHWRGLADRFNDTQRIELLMLVGFYRMLAGFLNSAEVELEH